MIFLKNITEIQILLILILSDLRSRLRLFEIVVCGLQTFLVPSCRFVLFYFYQILRAELQWFISFNHNSEK